MKSKGMVLESSKIRGIKYVIFAMKFTAKLQYRKNFKSSGQKLKEGYWQKIKESKKRKITKKE